MSEVGVVRVRTTGAECGRETCGGRQAQRREVTYCPRLTLTGWQDVDGS